MKKRKSDRASGYLSLCYHYIRPKREHDLFLRLLGNRIDEFHRHIRMLKRYFRIMSLDDARDFSYSDFSPGERNGMLITFDDGLSDHYAAAEILAQYGIKGTFFIPTCILMEEVPANPTIIHYSLAIRGIGGFLPFYRDALEENRLDVKKYNIKFQKGIDDPWKTIAGIKDVFRYRLGYKESRKVLVSIYKNLLLKEYPEAMKIMHIDREQIKGMLDMGHSVGVHSHSHISVEATSLTESDFKKEVIAPKKYIEETFDASVYALSYPFGSKKDCLNSQALINQTKEYALAFSVEKILNTKNTSPFELGRYMPRSTDDEKDLKKVLDLIAKGKGGAI